jgi:hypothetical protein
MRKLTKTMTGLKISGKLVDIQTGYFSNTNSESYCSTNLMFNFLSVI